METITIGVRRIDVPPYNQTIEAALMPDRKWWAYAIEAQLDGTGKTKAEAIGNLMLEIWDCYKDGRFPYPYIKQIMLPSQPLPPKQE